MKTRPTVEDIDHEYNCGRRDDYTREQEYALKQKYAAKKVLPIKDRAKKLTAYLESNHKKYLEETILIGFTDSFPEDKKEIVDEITLTRLCRGFSVEFRVRYGKVTFGPNNEYWCYGITTDRVEINDRLQNGGFGSYSHVDEADTMEKAVTDMARKNGLMVCRKICSWPFAKAIVQEVTDAFLR